MSMPVSRFAWRLLALTAALALAFAGPAAAQSTLTWNGGTTGLWNNLSANTDWKSGPTNVAWTPGSIATITASSTVTLSDNVTVNQINVTTGTSLFVPSGTANGTVNTITFQGANPAIFVGQSGASVINFSTTPYTGAAGTTGTQPTVAVISAAQLDVHNKQTTITGSPAVNFGSDSDSFAGGILIQSDNSSLYKAVPTDPTQSFTDPTAVFRVNFNTPHAAGQASLGTAGTITVAANGVRFSNVGSATAFRLQMDNNIVLNPNNISGFEIAIGATTPGTVVYSGNISGNVLDVNLGNDVKYAAGGAGLTIFNGVQKTYTGKTIVNSSNNGLFQIGAANVLPTTTTLQFGNIPYVAGNVLDDSTYVSGGPAAKETGQADLNGFNVEIAALSSGFKPDAAKVDGIVNTSSTLATLTISGAQTTRYDGNIGTSPSTGNGGVVQGLTTNEKIALVRKGTGTTILGGAQAKASYIGDTTITDTATLRASKVNSLDAGENAFSSNSDYYINGNGGNATLDIGGTTGNAVRSLSGNALGVVTSNGNYSFGNSDGVLTLGSSSSTNTNPVPNANFAGVIQDGTTHTGITKAGSYSQTLSGVNTYTGPTTVNGGSLVITGSLAAGSAVTVNTNAALRGTGTINGAVTVASGGTISPGVDSTHIGLLTVGSLSAQGGGIYNWKITNATGVSGTGYDSIVSPSALDMSGASSSNQFIIRLNSLGVTPSNFNPSNDRTWNIATFGSAVNQSDLASFKIDATGFKGAGLFSTFSVNNSGNNLQLVYTHGVAPPVLTWTNGGAGGAGNWAPSGGAAWTNSSNATGGWNPASSADFTGTAGTVTLTGAIAAPLVTFDVDGYTVAGTGGNALTAQAGYAALTVQVTNASQTGTISAPINSPLTLIGSGTLVLSSSTNNFGSGGIQINSGTLQGTVSSFGSTTAITNNGLIVFNETGSTTETYSGAMDGGGTLIKQGTGTLVLTGSNSFTGGTIIKQGTLRAASDSNLGNAAAPLTLDGGTLDTTGGSNTITHARSLTVTSNNGTIVDSGSGVTNAFTGGGTIAGTLTKNGPGTLQISANPFSGAGTIAIQAGGLTLGDPNDLNSNPSGILGNNNVQLAANGTLTIAGSSDANATVAFPTLSLAGNATVAVYKSSNGLAALNASLATATTINGGTLTVVGSPLANNTLTSSTVTLNGATTFTADTVLQADTAAGHSFAPTNLTIGAGVGTPTTDNGHQLTFYGQGNLSQGVSPSTIAVTGVGTDTSHPTLTGAWIVGDAAGANAVQLVISTTRNSPTPQLALTTGNVTVNQGSQLYIATPFGTYGSPDGSHVQTITLNGAGPRDPNPAHTGQTLGALYFATRGVSTFASNVNFNIASDAMITQTDGNNVQIQDDRINGAVTGSGTLILNGDNNSLLTLSGANNLTGGTTLKGGTLTVGAGSSIGTGPLTFAQTGGTDPRVNLYNATQSVGTLSNSFTHSPTQTSNIDLHLYGTALTVNQMADSDFGLLTTNPGPTDDAKITGTGSLRIGAASTNELTLSDTNSYAGGTTISGGSLRVLQDGNLGDVPASPTVGQVTIDGGQLHTSPGLASTPSNTFTLNQNRGLSVTSGGGKIKTDPGTKLVVSGQTSFGAGGNLTIVDGSYVQLAPSVTANSVGAGAKVTVAATATLELAGTASALVSDGSAPGSTAGRVNVVNNGAISSGGELLVSQNQQQVGAISGTGDTVVAPGATLLANSIKQNTLTIGAGSLVNLVPSDANGVSLVSLAGGGSDSLSSSSLTSLGNHLSAVNLLRSRSLAAAAHGATSSVSLSGGGAPSAVPEPSSLTLTAVAGLALLGLARRRRFASR